MCACWKTVKYDCFHTHTTLHRICLILPLHMMSLNIAVPFFNWFRCKTHWKTILRIWFLHLYFKVIRENKTFVFFIYRLICEIRLGYGDISLDLCGLTMLCKIQWWFLVTMSFWVSHWLKHGMFVISSLSAVHES